MDCSPPGSSVHGIFQAIVLEWIAISYFRGSSQPRDRTQVSHIVDRRFTIWATREVLTCSKTTRLKTSSSWVSHCLFIQSESEREGAQSCPTLCDPWTVTHQAPPSMEFSRQEYWSGLPFPSPGFIQRNQPIDWFHLTRQSQDLPKKKRAEREENSP